MPKPPEPSVAEQLLRSRRRACGNILKALQGELSVDLEDPDTRSALFSALDPYLMRLQLDVYSTGPTPVQK